MMSERPEDRRSSGSSLTHARLCLGLQHRSSVSTRARCRGDTKERVRLRKIFMVAVGEEEH